MVVFIKKHTIFQLILIIFYFPLLAVEEVPSDPKYLEQKRLRHLSGQQDQTPSALASTSPNKNFFFNPSMCLSEAIEALFNPKLKHAYLSGLQITKVPFIPRLSQLTILNLYGTNVKDVSPLSGHRSLQHVELGKTRVINPGILATLPRLTYAGLGENQCKEQGAFLKSLTELRYSQSIRSLNLAKNNLNLIFDLSFIGESPLRNSLKMLNLEESFVQSLAPLQDLNIKVVLTNEPPFPEGFQEMLEQNKLQLINPNPNTIQIFFFEEEITP